MMVGLNSKVLPTGSRSCASRVMYRYHAGLAVRGRLTLRCQWNSGISGAVSLGAWKKKKEHGCTRLVTKGTSPPLFPYKIPIFKKCLHTTMISEKSRDSLDSTIWHADSHNWAPGYREESMNSECQSSKGRAQKQCNDSQFVWHVIPDSNHTS